MRTYLQDVTTVNFYGSDIVTGFCEETSKFYVPMKHIVEDHLGLGWEVQRRKLDESPIYTPILVSGESLGDSFNNANEYICLPLAELNIFLCQINVLRVPVEVRDTLLKYQLECTTVLHDYWMYGAAINGRVKPFDVTSDLRDYLPLKEVHRRFTRASESYAEYYTRQSDNDTNAESVRTAVYSIIQEFNMKVPGDDMSVIEEFILAYQLKAVADILYLMIRNEVCSVADEFVECITANLLACTNHSMGDILTIKAPYSPFPGANDGLPRELRG
jgi:hypothetical protein